jgi:NADH dehydrogenase
MPQRILIVGAGFAGVWSALGAARLLDAQGKTADVEIALIAPEPFLHLRPRLHEAGPSGMSSPLLPLFEATGIRYIQGHVEQVCSENKTVDVIDNAGKRFTLTYDRLVLATGSKLFRPAVPGLAEYAHSIDQIDEAARLDAHFMALADLPAMPGRNTVIVAGGGFTGIEIAAELPGRLREAWGHDAAIKVIVVEQAADIGPDLDPNPRPLIEMALRDLGVESQTGTAVTSIDADGIWTSNGERIDAKTVIWTAGLRASALTEQIPAERDRLGRLHTDADLKVAGASDIYATGDVALALTDDDGHHALMSCQHAMTMGRISGHNAAADLLGIPTISYRQPRYVTCLDLGGWGALVTEGWNREVKLVGAEAKALKRTINTEWIYPPEPNRAAAFAAADPAVSVVA